MKCSRIQSDGMRYLDGEMCEEERVEYERHLEECEDCRKSIENFRELRALTGRIKMRDPQDEFWDKYWRSIYRRIERKTAWIFIIVGALMLVAYEVFRAFRSFGEITFEKIALVIFIFGLILLLVSVVRERIHQYGTDRYKDVER